MSVFDSIMSDTVGTVYRAATGKVDPWTQSELTDQATQSYVQAGMTPEAAASQAAQDIQTTISSASSTWLDAAKTTFGSAFHDDGSGCGITNLGGCFPSWFPYVVIGAGVIFVLWLLRPYVEILED